MLLLVKLLGIKLIQNNFIDFKFKPTSSHGKVHLQDLQFCDNWHHRYHHRQVPVGPHHHHRGSRLLAFPLLLRHCRQKGRTDADGQRDNDVDDVIVTIMMIRGVHHPV